MFRNSTNGFSRISLVLIVVLLSGAFGTSLTLAKDNDTPVASNTKPTIAVQENEHTAVFFVKYQNAAVELTFLHPTSDEKFRPSALPDGNELVIQAQFGNVNVSLDITATDNDEAAYTTIAVPEATTTDTASWTTQPTCDKNDAKSPAYSININGWVTTPDVFVAKFCRSAGILPGTQLQLDQKALRKEVRSWMSDTKNGTISSDGNNVVRYEATDTSKCPDFRIPFDTGLSEQKLPIGLFGEGFQAVFNITSGNTFWSLQGACKAIFLFTVIPW